MAQRLILVHISGQAEQVRKAVPSASQATPWLFLCRDYPQGLSWQERLGPGFRRVELGEALANVGWQLRRPFLDLMTELGRRHQSLAWWASRISERNTAFSPLFLYCCYLRLGCESLATTPGTLCVIGESWAVLEALAEAAPQYGCQVHWVTRPTQSRRRLLLLARIVRRLVGFLGRALSQLEIGYGSRPSLNGRPHILLRTWVDEACFGDDGVFHDRYLPDLCGWLEQRGWTVTTIPVLYNPRRPNRAAWKWLRHSCQQFLNPGQYYRLSDYLFALRVAWQQMRIPTGPVYLDGLDVSHLFNEAREHHALDIGSVEAILSYQLPRRLAEAGYSIDVLIDPFENMIPEKPLILGFRRYLPATTLVGFQHGALYPFLLCNFITAGETEFAPMPDRIVCNGDFFREVLVREGLPTERVVTGPSLRYGHLWQLTERPLPPRAAPAIVFVPLPLMLPEAVELMLKVCRALENLPALRVYLKPHPMSSLETLLKAAHLERLPAHFEFVGGGMGEWLAQAHVAVGMSSSTVYEIVAAGVPLVVVGRETGLELNPLSWYPEWRQVYVTPEDIRAEVARWLDASPEELEAYRRRARQILTASFKKINDDTLQVFIEGLPTREGNLT